MLLLQGFPATSDLATRCAHPALASPDKVIGVVLLCALSLPAVYVGKWAFMCRLRWAEHSAGRHPAAAKLPISPNSASVERVFSIMKNTFGDQMDHALIDYLALSLRRQYKKKATSVGAFQY